MLPDVSLGAAQTGFVQPKITQTASMTHGIKRSRELFMGKNRNSPDANTSGGSVKGGAIAGATVTRSVLDEISGPMGRPAWTRAVPITSDNICHIKSNGVGVGWVEISYSALHTLQFAHDLRKHAHAKGDMPGGPAGAHGSCVCQAISFAMYPFRRLRGNPDRFLNPWENSCRGCWSCRGTV